METNSQKTSDKKPKRICLLQLTRIGDVIQTFQAAKQLKEDHPEVQLFLIARKSMARQLAFLLDEVFEEVFYIDLKDFSPGDGFALNNSLERINTFCAAIGEKNLDLLVNLSFNKSSSYLASLVPCRLKMGIRRNEANQLEVTDKWSQYVYSTVMNSALNPFNLVDIYKYILGAKIYEPPQTESTRDKLIVVHPFASAKKKRWGANKWVDLIHKTLKENKDCKLAIVGAPSDAKEAHGLANSPALAEFKDRINDTTGSDSVEETYKLLLKARLAICHDSMVSHLAAVAGTPTLVLSLGTVRPSETTPYQRNVLNVSPRRNCFPCEPSQECELLPCHKDISHQLAASLAGAVLREETLDDKFFAEKVSPFYLNNVSVFAPHFTEMGMELIDITQAPLTKSDVFRTFYRIMWSFYLKGVDSSYPLPSLSNEILASLVEHQKGCGYIFELYGFGMKYAKAIIEEAKKEDPKIKKIQENISKLAEIDQLCALTKGSYPMLKPVVDFFFVNKANAQGNNIIDITESNLLSFYEGQTLSQILYDLMDKITAPSMVKSKETEV